MHSHKLYSINDDYCVLEAFSKIIEISLSEWNFFFRSRIMQEKCGFVWKVRERVHSSVNVNNTDDIEKHFSC